MRRGVPLAGSGSGDIGGDLVGAVVVLVLMLLFGWIYTASLKRPFDGWLSRRGWKVGVVRVKADRWGALGGLKVAHKERVAGIAVPMSRLAELADEACAGKFAA